MSETQLQTENLDAAEQPEVETAPVDNSLRGLWLRYRWAAVILMFVGGYAIVWAFGLQEYFERDRLREIVAQAGAWGVLVFLLIFAAGNLAHIPGVVFVAVAMMIYNPWQGAALSLVGGVLAVTVSFIVVRFVGGQPLGEWKNSWAQKVLGHLEVRPILAVALLRLVFLMASPLNYTLAMTRIKLRDYVIGSTLGLLAPILLVSLLFDWMIGTWL